MKAKLTKTKTKAVKRLKALVRKLDKLEKQHGGSFSFSGAKGGTR